MDFLSDVESYICIVNLLKHELVNRCGKVPPGIQGEYFLEYSITGPRIPAHAALGAAQAIGNAVVALIFSIAKREVTFLSGTVAISRL
jgi:hypothetical protein